MLYAVSQRDPRHPGSYVPATPGQAREGLRIVRNGQPLAAEVPMTLALGDAVSTGPDTAAVIRFPEGDEATLLPRTQARLGSLIADAGEFFVRVFRRPQADSFKVKTRYVTAGVAGTEFWVRVGEQSSSIQLGVLDGMVNLSSNSGGWNAIELRRGDVASADGASAPARTRDAAAVDAIVQMMRGLPRPMLPPMPRKMPGVP